MARTRHSRHDPGTAPGVLHAPPGSHRSKMDYVAYGAESLREGETASIAELTSLRGRFPVLWVNVCGLGSVELLEELGEVFSLHRLALEDVLNVSHRPKLEAYPENHFLVFRMPDSGSSLESEQVSLFVGKDFVVTFQEREGDCFDPVRRRIREGRPRIRSHGADYLTYALLDVVVDSHFPVVEHLGTRLDELEDRIVRSPSNDDAGSVHELKHDLATIRRHVWPLREIHSGLARQDDDVFTEYTQMFLRDSADHTHQLLDLVDSYRDAAASLMDLNLSLMSQRMNEIMKVLTIIATIFIPLSFIAGVYGMNFDPDASMWNLPELRWKLGYPFALTLMAIVSLIMLGFMRRRGWFR